MSDQPPQGTITEILSWVDGDPGKAAVALEAEQATDSPRSSLVATLEKIATPNQEEAVSESTTTTDTTTVDEGEEPEQIPEPRAPTGVTIVPGETGTFVSPVEVFPTDDEEAPDPAELDIQAAVDWEADEQEPYEAEQVTSLQTVRGTGGAILIVNGNAYGFSKGQVAVLGRLVTAAG